MEGMEDMEGMCWQILGSVVYAGAGTATIEVDLVAALRGTI